MAQENAPRAQQKTINAFDANSDPREILNAFNAVLSLYGAAAQSGIPGAEKLATGIAQKMISQYGLDNVIGADAYQTLENSARGSIDTLAASNAELGALHLGLQKDTIYLNQADQATQLLSGDLGVRAKNAYLGKTSLSGIVNATPVAGYK